MLITNNSLSMSIHSSLSNRASKSLLKSMSMDLCMQGIKDWSRGLDKRIFMYMEEDNVSGIGGMGMGV